MMPKMNGYQFIKSIRQNTSFPIIIISAKTMDEDEVLGLNIGADAYIKKPFNPLVVVAQINAAVRRAYALDIQTLRRPGEFSRLIVGDLEFDTEKFLLYKKGELAPHDPRRA